MGCSRASMCLSGGVSALLVGLMLTTITPFEKRGYSVKPLWLYRCSNCARDKSAFLHSCVEEFNAALQV